MRRLPGRLEAFAANRPSTGSTGSSPWRGVAFLEEADAQGHNRMVLEAGAGEDGLVGGVVNAGDAGGRYLELREAADADGSSYENVVGGKSSMARTLWPLLGVQHF